MTGWAPDHLPGNTLLWPKVGESGLRGWEAGGRERAGGRRRERGGVESTGSWMALLASLTGNMIVLVPVEPTSSLRFDLWSPQLPAHIWPT